MERIRPDMPAPVRKDLLRTDRFVVRDKLGAGGMGEVYRAFDRESNREVALKLLRDAKHVYRFKREFRALADIVHPNLVRLHELVSSGDQWFFTMELVDGPDFVRWVRGAADADGDGETADNSAEPATVSVEEPGNRSSGPGPSGDAGPSGSATAPENPLMGRAQSRGAALPLDTPAQWSRLRDGLRQLAFGVQALHDRGTLHRDIKPSNVHVTSDGRLVLLDFGVVTELARPDAAGPGSTWGTPAYMAPEIGTGDADGAIDWYAVGVMLYETMSGRRPFVGTPREMLAAKRAGPPPPLRELVPGVPADLEALCMDLLIREPERRASGSDVRAVVGTPGVLPRSGAEVRLRDTALIGREPHLATLHGARSAVLGGQARIVVVSGPSGVGKSTLVSRFLAEVKNVGAATVIAGRCYERESVPFKAVDDLIDSLCQVLSGLSKHEVQNVLPRSIGALARLFPLLEQIDAIREAARSAPPSDDSPEQRRLAFRALRELLVRLCARTRLVLYIDDAQWGDDDSAALLTEVFRGDMAPSALLVGCRDDVDGPFLAQVRSIECARDEIVVAELSPADTLTAARTLLTAVGAPLRFAEPIAREAGGNPFVVTELVRHVATGADAEAVGLADVVRARVAEVSAPAGRLLALLAVAAWPVPRALALAAAGITAADGDVVTALLGAHLISVRGGKGGDALVVFHDRVRAEVAASVAAAEALAIHRAVADAIRASGAGFVDHLAEHLELSGDPAEAGECYVRAADAAARKLAFERAARLYARALALLAPTGDRRRELYALRASVLQLAGKGVDAAAAYLEAARDADHAQALRYRGLAAQQLLRVGHINEGLAVLQDVLAAIGIRLPRSRLGAIVSFLASRVRVRLRGLDFAARNAADISLADLTRIDVCWTASATLGMCDTTSGAVFQARHLLAALRAGEAGHVSHALALEAVYRALPGGDLDDVDAVYGRALDLADQSGDPMSIAWAHGADAITRYQLGQWRRSCASAQRALEVMQGRGIMWFERTSVELYRLWSLYWLGGFRELTERSTVLLADAEAMGDLYSATNLSLGRPALQWLIRGKPDDGRRIADHAMAQWSHERYHLQHAWHASALAHADLYEGLGVAAWERLRAELPRTRKAMLTRIRMLRIETIWALGRAALGALALDRRREEPLRDARRAIRDLERDGRADAVAMAMTLRAGVVALTESREAAVPILTVAAGRASQQEMGFLAAAAQAARGRILGGDHGAALTRDAELWMRDQSVVDPIAMARVFLPGLEER
jgi:tetratricopeptide (TPR) repeat protein